MECKGKLIAFEGLDGSGKTTLLSHVVSELMEHGRRVRVTRSPGGTLFANGLLDALRAHKAPPLAQALSVIAGRIDLLEKVVRPALEEGELVFVDRWNWSTLAYGTYTAGADELDTALLGRISHLQSLMADLGIPEADATVLVAPGIETCVKRLSLRDATDVFESEGTPLMKHADLLYSIWAEDSLTLTVDTKESVAQSVNNVLKFMDEKVLT